MSTVIDINEVSFSYNGGPSVLDNVTLRVEAKEFIGVIGPNGGGKTTLLKLILGLLQPTSGSVTVLGQKAGSANARIGYVPQFSSFDLDFPVSVLEVVLMGYLGIAAPLMKYRNQQKLAAKDILQQLGVGGLSTKPIGELSGGQLQRVMVARALVCEPAILLLDEPTANIDLHGEENIFELLRNINSKVSIIVVSHDIGFISKYIKRVACLNQKLFCHDTYALTPEIMQKIYGIPVRAINHE